MQGTFYWHDYETFGADPSRDRPVQFAGLRTDAELNEVGAPLLLYCRPARDVLPQPEACLLTGITPARATREGLIEAEFIAQIHAQLAQPQTCTVGYNSIRFDDEVTRYCLYRNFYDPYAREWRDGNSRWDIIDMVRLTYALRPQGIEWPQDENGHSSFRLGALTAANGIEHSGAHDALSDVRATLDLARLIRQRQPRLFDYALHLRHKQAVLALLDMKAMQPLLHISGMFGAARHNSALIAPVVCHPVNKNEIICCDLAADPAALAELDIETLRERLYTPTAELPQGVERPGIKSVHINKSPMLVKAAILDADSAARLHIDLDACAAHRLALQGMSGLADKLQQVVGGRQHRDITDPDRMLYSGGFFSAADRRVMDQLRATTPAQLAAQSFVFADPRGPEMLFRYRARNYPETLSAAEQAQWREQRLHYLTDPQAGAGITLDSYRKTIANLQAATTTDAAGQQVLAELLAWGTELDDC